MRAESTMRRPLQNGSDAWKVLALALLVGGCPRRSSEAGVKGGDGGQGVTALEAGTGTATGTGTGETGTEAGADVVSSASVGGGWDAGAVIAKGEVDGAGMRAATRARLRADRGPVTMLAGGSARELGERLCTTVVPPRPKATPVLIKPNLGGFEWFKDPARSNGDDGVRGRITDPEFVRGIVRCLKARGHERVTIAEGWGATHADWQKLVKVSGYEAMAREEGVALVAMDDDGVFDVEGDQPGKPLHVRGMEKTHTPTLLMPKILAEHLERGLFISAPKVKAHRFGVVSMAIKGGQGVVLLSDAAPAFRQKWRMHRELSDALKLLPKDPDAGHPAPGGVPPGQAAYLAALEVFAERMADVLEVAAPHVVLAEGAPGMGGDGFGKRWPTPERVAIGGTNPILVDRVGAAFLGLWDRADLAAKLGGHRTSPLLETAAKRFGVDIASPTVQGDGAALLAAPRPVHFVSMSGFALHSDDRPAELAPAPPSSSPASSASAAAGTGSAEVSAPSSLHAHRVEDGSLRIDGAREAAWAAARPVTFDTDWAGQRTSIATTVRAAWSPKGVYLLWELASAGMNVDASRPVAVERAKLYEEDCVEVFLGVTPGEPRRYFEVEVGPLGHFLDLSVDRTTKKADTDLAWSSRPEIATSVSKADDHRVTIEMALRAPEIASAMVAGKQLPLALYRMEGKAPRAYLAFRPTRTPKPNFHVPEAFGTLVLEPD